MYEELPVFLHRLADAKDYVTLKGKVEAAGPEVVIQHSCAVQMYFAFKLKWLMN